jgi:hypothetical protein
VRYNALGKISVYGSVLRYLAVLGFMVMACRWVTILRARRNRKFYGESEPYFFLTNHVLVFLLLFTVMVMVTVGPVETLLAPRFPRAEFSRNT